MEAFPMIIADVWHSPWVQGGLAFAVWILVFTTAHRILMGMLRRMAARTSWTWDDVLIGALRLPSYIAIFASGLVVMGRIMPLEPEWDRACDILLAGAFVLALILFVDHATGGLLDRLSRTQ